MQPAKKAHLVGLDEIAAARRVIAGTLHRTPMITSAALGERIGARLHFKAELFQKTGSFKPRGALNKLSTLSDEEKARGVITISAGNHAQALAYTAARSGIAATVVMPAAAVQSKVDATRGYGAEVVLHGSHKDLLPKMQEFSASATSRTFRPSTIPPSSPAPAPSASKSSKTCRSRMWLVVPIGGGGLISGIAAAHQAEPPRHAHRRRRADRRGGDHREPAREAPAHWDTLTTSPTAWPRPSSARTTWPTSRRFVDAWCSSATTRSADALRLIVERCKVMPEPSGAAADRRAARWQGRRSRWRDRRRPALRRQRGPRAAEGRYYEETALRTREARCACQQHPRIARRS